MNMPLVCTSKNIWAELSYEVGPSCLIKFGRVGMGRVLCGPSWHGPSWFWAELSVILFTQQTAKQTGGKIIVFLRPNKGKNISPLLTLVKTFQFISVHCSLQLSAPLQCR